MKFEAGQFGSTARPEQAAIPVVHDVGRGCRSVVVGAAFALNEATVGQVLTIPRFSATKTRPPGA